MAHPRVLSRKYDGPRAVRPNEVPAVLKLINRMFTFVKTGMERESPHIYRRMAEFPERHRIITCRGEVAAHTAIIPLEFVTPAGRETAGGIGCVCTNPKYRGRGLMSRLLEHAGEKMRAARMPFSILWGDRLRYARFGWEPAGRKFAFGLDARSREALVPFKFRVEKLEDLDAEAEELHEIHREVPFRVERDPETFKLMLERPGRAVWVARRGRKVEAWAMAGENPWIEPRHRRGNWVVEYAAGTTEGILGLLRWFLVRCGARSVRMIWPLGRTAVPVHLLEAMNNWSSTIEFLGQIRVLDPAAMLAGFGARAVTPAFRKLRLSPRAQARLLLGPFTPEQNLPASRGSAAPFRRLPLDLFMWPADHV